jgi:hypothetical protein
VCVLVGLARATNRPRNTHHKEQLTHLDVDITSLRKEELRSPTFLKLLMSTLNFDLLLGGSEAPPTQKLHQNLS